MLTHKHIADECQTVTVRLIARWAALCLFLTCPKGMMPLGQASEGDLDRLQTSLRSQNQKRSTPQITTVKRSQSRRKFRLRRPDVIYYPTPEETVMEMLRFANIKQDDVLYDLGSGDGRIPIMAAKQYGIRAVGIEIDPKLVAIAQKNARLAHVENLVSFRNTDMFRTDLRPATVVTLYLSNRLNLLLRPKLLRELRRGSRIVSHDFHMGDWVPDDKIRVPWHNNLYRTVYLWTVSGRRTRGAGKAPRIGSVKYRSAEYVRN